MTAPHLRQTAAPAGDATPPAAGMLRGLLRALANRREVGRLGDLSDAALADIGLMRGDLHFARRTPFGVDPTRRLATVAHERVRSLCGGRG